MLMTVFAPLTSRCSLQYRASTVPDFFYTGEGVDEIEVNRRSCDNHLVSPVISGATTCIRSTR